IGAEILAESRLTLWPPEQVEGREIGQIQPLEENEGGLNTPIGEEQVALELGQGVAITSHVAPRAVQVGSAGSGENLLQQVMRSLGISPDMLGTSIRWYRCDGWGRGECV